MNFIAHVKQNEQGTGWEKPQLLEEHLVGTAKLAKKFASKFGFSEFGEILGILHDAGKATNEWQEYIREKAGFDENQPDKILPENKTGKIEHSIHGAQKAEQIFSQFGRLLSYCIAGHHSGLPDFYSEDKTSNGALKNRLEKKLKPLNTELIDNLLKNCCKLKFNENFVYNEISISLFIRMLFSCLVDADFLDTEKYMSPENYNKRGDYSIIRELKIKFDEYMLNKEHNSSNTPINAIRHKIANDCKNVANDEQGIFTLTVPTGGGKTLASLAFALKHAIKHNLNRIIYVIPYTSIIEQTANIFKDIFGEENVVEHHSNIVLDNNENDQKTKLAIENWDAPIIVTTSVQFFESLFSAKTSKCRKLHNIVKSVIILDEAQLIPTEYLIPIIKTIECLVKNYFVSFVVSTATQPMWSNIKDNGKEIMNIKTKEIISDVKYLYDNLKRVNVAFPETHDYIELSDLANELCQYKQVLCIVSDRKTCRDLFKLMPNGTYHLSALMCGEHRSDIIKQIKDDLNNDKEIRVISTQLIEAGVDIDFPVVYRSIAGLDSIAQSAGRCNREGKLKGLGKVNVFRLNKKLPAGILKKAAEKTEEMLEIHHNNLMEPESFMFFFKSLYGSLNSLDSKKIIKHLTPDEEELAIKFNTVSNDFKIIDDSMTKTIIVKYKKSIDLLEHIKNIGNKLLQHTVIRKLQRYTVNIYKDDFEKLKNRGSISELWFEGSDTWALESELEYNKDVGLIIENNNDFVVSDDFII